MDGEYTVDQADEWYDDGLFTASGRAPSHELRGDWRNPNGKGRSLYVGRRKNGKMCRVYEKGMEQGDQTSPWVRFEVDLHAFVKVFLDSQGFKVETRDGVDFVSKKPAEEQKGPEWSSPLKRRTQSPTYNNG